MILIAIDKQLINKESSEIQYHTLIHFKVSRSEKICPIATPQKRTLANTFGVDLRRPVEHRSSSILVYYPTYSYDWNLWNRTSEISRLRRLCDTRPLSSFRSQSPSNVSRPNHEPSTPGLGPCKSRWSLCKAWPDDSCYISLEMISTELTTIPIFNPTAQTHTPNNQW